MPEGLPADGREGFLSAGRTSGRGLPSGFTVGLVGPADGLVVVDDGLAVLPDGLVELVDGLVAVPEGLVASLFEEPEDREYDEPDDCLDTEDEDLETVADDLDVEDDLEVEDDGLEPRDCASISGWKAANANPISIAAKVLADNLIVLDFLRN